MKQRFVYADNAATTKISEHVLNEMIPFLKDHYGNPSSIYSVGREAKVALEEARGKVAKALNADPNEIYFTAGGSEAGNWAIRSIAELMAKKGKKHLITTNFEHHAVLHTMQALEEKGFEVTYLPVDEKGLITAEQVSEAIREDTALVSAMYANNEIGTIMPIKEIGAVCKAKDIYFHTDAVQAVGHVPIDVRDQNIDLLSLSGHKFHAPKGVGALYCRKGIPLHNLIFGGAQERGKRAGTENTASIIGMGAAIEDACADLPEKIQKVKKLRDQLIDRISSEIPKCRLNGDREKRVCGNVNFSFEGIEGEGLLLLLDMNGICASSGSACTSGSLDPSHVLLAIGLPHEIAHGSLRLSINEETTQEDVDYIMEKLPQIVERLRAMSPVWDKN